MSAPDASLSPQERAALANLEAAAMADDPHLAARLRGSGQAAAQSLSFRVSTFFVATWVWLRQKQWLGAPFLVVGMGLMVLGVAYGLWMGAIGAVLATVGLALLAEMLVGRLAARRDAAGPTPD